MANPHQLDRFHPGKPTSLTQTSTTYGSREIRIFTPSESNQTMSQSCLQCSWLLGKANCFVSLQRGQTSVQQHFQATHVQPWTATAWSTIHLAETTSPFPPSPLSRLPCMLSLCQQAGHLLQCPKTRQQPEVKQQRRFDSQARQGHPRKAGAC